MCLSPSMSHMKCSNINVNYDGDSWCLSVSPKGYGCRSSDREKMPGECVVTFYSFVRNNESLDSINPMSSVPSGIELPNSGLAKKVKLLDNVSDSDHDP